MSCTIPIPIPIPIHRLAYPPSLISTPIIDHHHHRHQRHPCLFSMIVANANVITIPLQQSLASTTLSNCLSNAHPHPHPSIYLYLHLHRPYCPSPSLSSISISISIRIVYHHRPSPISFSLTVGDSCIMVSTSTSPCRALT